MAGRGRPGPAPQTAKREQYAALIARGVNYSEACRIVGINRRTGKRWRHGRTITTYREEAGRLIRWARTNKLTTTQVASTKWNGPAQLLDHQHRWDTARRLLHDDNLKPEDRLAGLLILLYAQTATAISRMAIEQIHVDDNDVRLRLGRVPIQLPEPVATLARTVVSNRKGHATIGTLTPSP
jgi:hypothetical protein